MKRVCKELLQKNNKREKEINKNNNKIYTDMIVYLRSADMSMYNQELVREDLIEMIIDGQNRGEDIEKVMGGNYEEICDEIIATMPKRTKHEKIYSILELSLSAIWIIGFIYILKTALINFATNTGSFKFTLTIGSIINMIIIVAAANILVEHTCKSAFRNKDKNKVLQFIKRWIICFTLFGVIFISSYYLSNVVVSIPMIVAIIFVTIVFVLDRIVTRYVE